MAINRFKSRPANFESSNNSSSKTTKAVANNIKQNQSPSILSMMLRKWRLITFVALALFLAMLTYSSMAKDRRSPLPNLKNKRDFRGGSARTGKLFDPNSLPVDPISFQKTDLATLDIKSSMNSEKYEKAYKRASKLSKDYNINNGELLAPMLVPRVVGTDSYYKVQRFLVGKLTEYGFEVSFDNFTDSTPLGQKSFSNIIGIKNPKATNRLVLAAHYDSKYFTKGEFIGATDSSVPVALILGVCKSLIDVLDRSEKTLQVIFFDGEEAFKDWTATDSLYGARHLASKWSTQLDEVSAKALPNFSKNELELMDMFVLLDLIGASDTNFVPLRKESLYLFNQIASMEQELLDLGHVSKTYFQSMPSALTYMSIDDDHRPFVEKGVSVMHLISNPFPSVWHTLDDDGKHLDPTTIENINVVIITFVAAYLNLPL